MRRAFLLLLFLLSVCRPGCADSLPPPVVPQCVGVNIHFAGAPARDLDGLAQGGFGWIRMDFVWEAVEKVKGQYDFSAYDQLLDGLTARHIRPLFILDYGNALYQDGSPRSPEAQAAFARFAAASAAHFHGKPILWEIWNEPNGGFWKPRANAEEYGRLALVTAQAIKRADPGATVLAPGTSGIPLDFLEHLFRMGLLKYIDAVSLHPYRGAGDTPETAAREYRPVRLLIHSYAPKGKQIALVSSEWGYSSVNVSEENQAQFLAREWLSNLAEGVRLSIWYDWHEDGTDPKDPEAHFGTVRSDYTPKPAFLAAKSLTEALRGFAFVKRLQAASDKDYLLLFADGPAVKIAAWTTGDEHEITLPSGPRLALNGTPQYLSVSGDTALRTAASWAVTLKEPAGLPAKALLSWRSRDARVHRVRFTVHLMTPGGALSALNGEEDRVTPDWEMTWVPNLTGFSRAEMQGRVSITVDGKLQPYGQEFVLTPSEPVTLSVTPQSDTIFQVQVMNPAGTPFAGVLGFSMNNRLGKLPVRMGAGQTSLMVSVPGSPANESFWAVRDAQGHVLSHLEAPRFVPCPEIVPLLTPVLDGDLKVASTAQSQSAAGPAAGTSAYGIAYHFAPGWSFWRAAPPQAFPLPGQPVGIGMWVRGDGSGNSVEARVRDATGQTFQLSAPDMTWLGWKFVTFRLVPPPGEAPHMGHWGGADDGQVHYPVQIDTLLLLDSRTDALHSSGVVLLSSPCTLYEAGG